MGNERSEGSVGEEERVTIRPLCAGSTEHILVLESKNNYQARLRPPRSSTTSWILASLSRLGTAQILSATVSDDITDAKVCTYSKRRGYRKASCPSASSHKFGRRKLDRQFATEDHKRSDPVALDTHQVAPKDIATDRYDCDLDSVDEPDSSPAHILEMKELAQHLCRIDYC